MSTTHPSEANRNSNNSTTIEIDDTFAQTSANSETAEDPKEARVRKLYEADYDLPTAKYTRVENTKHPELRINADGPILILRRNDANGLDDATLLSTTTTSPTNIPRKALITLPMQRKSPKDSLSYAQIRESESTDQQPPKDFRIVNKPYAQNIPMTTYLKDHQMKDGVAFTQEPTQQLRLIAQILRQRDDMNARKVSPAGITDLALELNKQKSTEEAARLTNPSNVPESSISELEEQLLIAEFLAVADEIEKLSTRRAPYDKGY